MWHKKQQQNAVLSSRAIYTYPMLRTESIQAHTLSINRARMPNRMLDPTHYGSYFAAGPPRTTPALWQ